MPRSVSIRNVNNDANRQAKTIDQAIQKSVTISASVNTVNTVSPLNTEQLETSCENRRRRGKKVVNPVIESGNVCHRKSERRRIARDIFLVFEEQCNSRRRSRHSNKKSTAKAKPKFGHLNIVENPVNKHAKTKLLQDIKNEPKCYLNNNNNNNNNNINININNSNNNSNNNVINNSNTTTNSNKCIQQPETTITTIKKSIKCQNTCTNTVDVKANVKSSTSSVALPTTLPLSLSTVTPIAKVNPIFLWTKQDDTRIVEVRCEDYDKRNRIRLTKTSNGNWKAIPCTDPTSTKVVRCLYTPTPPLMKVKCEKDLEQQQRQQQHQTQLHDNQIDLLSNQNINNNSNNNNNKSNSDNSNCVFRRGIEELMVTPTIPTTPTRAIIATTPTAAAATTSDIDIKFNLVERKVVLNTANRKRSKRKGKSRKRKIIRNKSPNVNYLNRIGTPVDDNVPVKIRNNRVLETNKIFNQNLPLQACDNKCDVEAILPPSPSLPSSLLAPLASAPLPSTSTSPSPLSSPSFELVQSSLPQPNSNDQHVDSIKNVHTNSIHRSNENYDLALSIIRDSVTSTPVELVVPSIVNAYQSRLDDFNVQLCPKTGLFIPAITDNNNSDKLKNRNNINNNNTEASNCLMRRSDSNDDLVPVESTESSKISANKMNDIGNDIQNITVNNNEIETDERDIKLSTTLECAQTVVECKKSSDEMLMMTESLEAKTRNLKDLLDSADLLDHCDITNGHGNHEELIESLVKTSCEGNLMVEEKDHQQQQLQHQHQTEPEELQLLQLHQKLEREQNQQEVEQSESADRLTSSANELPKCLSFNEAGEIDFFQSNTCTELAFEKSPATSDSIIFHDTTEMVMTPIKATTPLFSLLNFDDDAPKDLSYKRRNLNDDICCPQSESSSQCAVTSSSDIMKSPATHPIGIGESLSFAAPSSDTMKNMVFEEFLKFNTQSTDQQQQQPVKTSQSNEPIDLGKRKLIGVTTKSNALANLMEQVIVDDDSDNNNNIVNGRSNNRENENCSDVINAKAVDDNVAPISQSLQTALNSSRYSDVDVKVVNANETGSSNSNGNGTVTGTGSNSGKPNTNKSHIKVPATTLMNEDPDPYTQLQLLLRNTQWKVPDPILVPKDRLGAVLASPAREIPLLITTRPELKLPEAFAYPEIIQNPNILVISMAQLEAILKNNELEKSKAINVTNNVEHDDNVLDKNVFGNEFNRKGHKSQITKIENNNKTIDKEKTAGVVAAAAAVAIAPPTVLATSKTPVMSHNSPQNKNVNVKSLQNYLDVEGSLGTEMNASTLAMLNQMLWLPYFGQLSQDIVKGSKTSAPLTLQHLQSFLPFYNAQASLKHLDDIYKNYWKHQQRQQHDVNDVNNILSMHHPHHQRQHQSKHYPNTSNLKAATVATATATGSAAVANNEIEKQCDKKQTHSKLINGFINNYNSDTSSKQYYGYPDVNLANIHSHIHHPYQDTQSYTTNLQQHQPHQSQLYKNHHRHQKTMTSNQYVMQQMIEEKSSNLLLNRLEKLNECSAPTEKSDDGNDKKPRLTCKSLANLLNPEYTHQNDLMISSHDAIIKAKNLLRSQLHNGYRTNQITNDAIVGGNTLTSSTNIKRSHKRSEMEKLYAKQTRCNLNGLNAATAAVVATTPASSQIINQSNDNPMPTASDISTPLWHPLFGSNSKSEYYSPWQWTTVTATGE